MTHQNSFFNAVQWSEKYPESKLIEIQDGKFKCVYCCQLVDDMDKHWIDHAEKWIEAEALKEIEQSSSQLGSIILESVFTKAGNYERTVKHGSDKLQQEQSTHDLSGKKKSIIMTMLNPKEIRKQALLIQKNIDHAKNKTKRFEPIGKGSTPSFLINTVNDNSTHADRITIAHDVKSIEVLSI